VNQGAINGQAVPSSYRTPGVKLIRYWASYKQLGIKKNRTSYRYNNSDQRTERHIMRQNVGNHYAKTYINTINKVNWVLQTTGGKAEPSVVFIRESQRTTRQAIQEDNMNSTNQTSENRWLNEETQTTLCTRYRTKIQHIEPKGRATSTSSSTRRWTPVLAKGNQFLILKRHPIYTVRSDINFVDDRKRNWEKMHCHLRYGYFIVGNQFMISTVTCFQRIIINSKQLYRKQYVVTNVYMFLKFGVIT
jgi:hypothetical protein